MFNKILIGSFVLVFCGVSLYLWQSSTDHSQIDLDSSSTDSVQRLAADINTSLSEEPYEPNSKTHQTKPKRRFLFDTQPFSGRDKIDPFEDEMLVDLPSLDAQEREAEAIIAEMDKLIERENMLAGSLDEDEIAQLRREQEALHQRLEALAQE